MSFIFALLGFGLLIVVHEFGHYIMAILSKMRVDRFSVGFGPTIMKGKKNNTSFELALIPLGGFVQIAGMNPQEEFSPDDMSNYHNRPAYQRFLTILFGPLMNFFSAVILFFVFFYFFFSVPLAPVKVSEVLENTPAQRAGIIKGDMITAIDEKPLATFVSFFNIIQAAPNSPLYITVKRNENLHHFIVVPYSADGVGKIGVKVEPSAYSDDEISFQDAVIGSVEQVGIVSLNILKSLKQMVSGSESVQLSGPIGIFDSLQEQVKQDTGAGFRALGVLSVALGLFNLLPIPALDGSRLMFLAVELISRRKVNRKIEHWVHFSGFVMLLGLMIVITFGDIARLIEK